MSSDPQIHRVRDIFDDWADRGRAEGMEAGHGFAARQGFGRLGLGAGSRYLDVGCGNGYTVRWAAALVGASGRAVGIDVSPRMVERARALSGPPCEFLVAAFPWHPLAPGSFDAVFSMEALYYVPDLDAALRAVASLLVPGGRFAVIVDYYAENEASHAWPDDLGCGMHLLGQEGWRDAFARAGLVVVEQERLRHPPRAGEPPSWKQTQGSLLTVGSRPRS